MHNSSIFLWGRPIIKKRALEAADRLVDGTVGTWFHRLPSNEFIGECTLLGFLALILNFNNLSKSTFFPCLHARMWFSCRVPSPDYGGAVRPEGSRWGRGDQNHPDLPAGPTAGGHWGRRRHHTGQRFGRGTNLFFYVLPILFIYKKVIMMFNWNWWHL